MDRNKFERLRKKIKELLKKHRKEHKVGNMFDHCYSIGFQGALMIVLAMLEEAENGKYDEKEAVKIWNRRRLQNDMRHECAQMVAGTGWEKV